MFKALKTIQKTTEFRPFLLATYRSHPCFGIQIFDPCIFVDLSRWWCWFGLEFEINWNHILWHFVMTFAKSELNNCKNCNRNPEITNFTKQLIDAPRAPHDGSGSHGAPTGRAARRWIWFEGLNPKGNEVYWCQLLITPKLMMIMIYRISMNFIDNMICDQSNW